jgi:hypothetical protein
MIHDQYRRLALACVMILLAARPAAAINLYVDYTYDTGQFFGAGNPQGGTAGLQAKAALENAAAYFSNILTDTFSAIQTPDPYPSSYPGSDGVVTWTWTQIFNNPTTGLEVTVTDATMPADRYIIYAGARGLLDSTAGVGGPGGYEWSSDITGTNSFTQSDINTMNATTAAFEADVERREEASGFARWGGVVTFDTSDRLWHFNHATSPAAGTTDFYSVAIHELAHSLGFGESSSPSTAWGAQLSGVNFNGTNAKALNGGVPVPLAADFSHWAYDKMSVVYGTSATQETAMDPDILDGTRKRLTALDAAALDDIGWDLATIPPQLYGDYNNNGKVDAADYVVWRKRLGQSVTIPNDSTPGSVQQVDYTVWRNSFGATFGGGSGSGLLDFGGKVPEPSAAAIFILSGACLSLLRRRRSA